MKSIISEVSIKRTIWLIVMPVLLLSGCKDRRSGLNDKPEDANYALEKTKEQKIEDASVNRPESNFVLIKLPRGIKIQIPNNWRLLTDDEKKLIEVWTEAVLDISNINVNDGEEVNLLAANSMPIGTYASVRVDSTVPAPVPPSEVIGITAREMRTLESAIQKDLEELLPQQGLQLLQFIRCRKETISGNPALITEYRRSGPKGPVRVKQIQIFSTGQTVAINLSYRESEQVIWKPVIEKIYRSISIDG